MRKRAHERLSWCREGELNPQGTKYRRILSPLRLPVPPSRLGWEAPSVSHKDPQNPTLGAHFCL